MEANLQKAVVSASLGRVKSARALVAMGVLGVSLVVGGSIFLPAGGANAQAAGLPDGPGRAFATENCSACHGIELVTAQRRTAEEWEQIVNRMIANGDTLTQDEYNEVVAYLGTYMGKDVVAAAEPASATGGTVSLASSAHDAQAE